MKRITALTITLLLLLITATVSRQAMYRTVATWWIALAQNGPAPVEYVVTATYKFHTLKHPTGLAYSAFGLHGLPGTPYLVIADTGNHVIREFDITQGTLDILAGNGTAGYVNGSLLSAEFNNPSGLQAFSKDAKDTNGHYWYWNVVYVGDSSNYVVRYFCDGSPYGNNSGCPPGDAEVFTYAGNHTKGYVNGPLTSAEFAHLGAMHMDMGYAVDSENHTIRSIGTDVETFAGTGTAGYVNGYRTSAQFNTPTKLAQDASGNIMVADAGNYVIRKIDSSGNVTTFAGNGQPGYVNGAGSSAEFNRPTSIAYNPADGYYYVADTFNNSIRRIASNGTVSTYAGSNQAGYADGSLSQARFSKPTDLTIANGFMYISDSNNNAIRRIDMSAQTVSTYID